MQKTIKSDMIRSNLIMILLVTVCISGLHLYQIYHYTIRQNQKEIMTMSEQAQNGLNYMLNQLDVLQYQIVDSLTQSAEYDRNSRDWTRESIEFLKNTENQLQTFRRAVPFVTNIYWLDNYGKLFTTDSFVNRELFEESQTLYRLEQEVKDACYVPPFTPEYQMEGDNVSVFSYLKNVYRMNRGREKRGVLQIDMRTSYLEELLTLINDNQYCLAYITTEDGSLFWFPDHPYQENGADYDLVYPLNNGWQLRVRYSNAFARRSLKNNLMSSIILLFIIIPLSILSVYKYSGYLTGPLQKLTKRMKKLESGELIEIHTISRFEEIRILEQGYNSMIAKMDDMMAKMTEIRTENINAKLLALQAQINPHFLANSFELIRSLAIQKNSSDIESITEALAMMYRYILNESQDKVTFEEELAYVKNYIRIQEYRFEQSIQVLYRVAPEALSCRMARLLIQPLVENAFIHGLELKEGVRWIMITGTVEEDRLYVEVKDNGIGIAPDRLQMLSEDICDYARKEDPSTKTEGENRDSIGLKNVNKRLYLRYGEASCLNITSDPKYGTSVSFRIRADKEETDGGI